MKCIVCNSQFIIYDGLGKKGEAPKCDKCNSSVVTTVNPPIAAYKSNTPANPAVPSTNPFNTSGPLSTPNTSNNPFNVFNNKKESKNALKNSGSSINAAGRGAKAENAAAIKIGGRRSTRKQRNNKKRATHRR